MFTKLTIHEIHSLGSPLLGERVTAPLPFEIMHGVTIEDVSGWLTDASLDWVSKHLGIYQTDALKNVRFALVHRYPANSSIIGTDEDIESEKLVRILIELIHIIRPMRQNTSIIRGQRDENNSFTVVGLDTPNQLEVPEVQKLYHLRDQDLSQLKLLAPVFIQAMRGNTRSAIEALYTSHSLDHQGKLVATERIKWFLGPQTPIYETGDIPDFILNQPNITIADVVDKVYNVRNYLAHGDIVPNDYFVTTMREGVAGEVTTIEVLGEAASFIVRQSLLRILRDGLLQHFENAATGDAYFAAQRLTKHILRKNRKP